MKILKVIDKRIYKHLKKEIEQKTFDKKYPFITREILSQLHILIFGIYTILLVLLALLLNKLLEKKLNVILNYKNLSITVIIVLILFLWGSHFILENYRDRNKELYYLGKKKYEGEKEQL